MTITPAHMTIMVATLRLGGVKSGIQADAIVDTPFALRPAMFAQSLAAGKTADMVKLVTASGLNDHLSRMAKERN